jgi:hypothetical protein
MQIITVNRVSFPMVVSPGEKYGTIVSNRSQG